MMAPAKRNPLRNSIVAVLFALALRPALAQDTTTSQTPAPFRWPVTLADIRESQKLSPDAIAEFVNAIRPVLSSAPIEVGAFRFAPMEGETTCLVVDADNSKRTSFSGVAVVCPGARSGSFQITIFYSVASSIPTGELVDLDGDGEFELVTGDVAGGYQGVNTVYYLAWYTVYRVKDGVPRDVSAQYRKFYVAKLFPELDLASRLLESTCKEPTGEAVVTRAKVRFLRAKFDRKILGNPRAGFEDAVGWGSSGNPALQKLAIFAFLEIDVPETLAELKKLVNATDRGVALFAAAAVEMKNEAHR